MTEETIEKAPEAGSDAQEPSLEDLTVILASGSPRRKQLLEEAGVAFSVRTSEVDETLEPDLLRNPEEAVKKLAERKAGVVVQEVLNENFQGMGVILGADTMVVLDGVIFGKPKTASEAVGMLRKLSGRTHQVMTAVSLWCVAAPEVENVSIGFRTFVETSHVTFKQLDDEAIKDYVASGEPYDKAGGYGIQGMAGDFVERLDGDFNNVMGLPVDRLLEIFPDLAPAR